MDIIVAAEPSHQPSRVSKFALIDFLRLSAAFFVMSYHARFLLALDDLRDDGFVVGGGLAFRMVNDIIDGPAAVMLFFVISGLCIHVAYINAPRIQLSEFYLRRYIRVGIPMLAACVATVILTRTWSVSPIPLWSLWCEVFYYLIYPLLPLLFAYVGFNVVFLAALTVALALSLLPDDYGGLPWAHGPFLTWLMYFPVWLMGVWIVENLSRFRRLPPILHSRWCLSAMGCVLVVLAAAIGVAPYHVAWAPKLNLALLLFAFPAACFVGLLVSTNVTVGPVLRFLDRQGRWSYSLYLVHGIIIALAVECVRSFGGIHFGAAGSLAVTFATMVCACVAAQVFYRFVERPSHKLAKQLAKRSVALSPLALEGPAARGTGRLLQARAPVAD